MANGKKCLKCGYAADISAAVCGNCGGHGFSEEADYIAPPYSKYTAARLTPKGREIYERAYDGDADAMCGYGQLLRTAEEGVDGDLIYAYEWFMRAARNGCAEGFYWAAVMQDYEEILGSEENGGPKEAVRLYKAGARLGNARCMSVLGRYYLTGRGVKADDARAFRYLSDAVAAGDKDAMLKAAECYLKGAHGFEHDPEKAKALYARADAPHFMYRDLRAAYLSGNGLPRDLAKAEEMGEKYLEELHRLFCTVPQTDKTCGFAWQIGQEYLDRDDIESAAEWFRTAMEHGDVMGKIELQRLKRL